MEYTLYLPLYLSLKVAFYAVLINTILGITFGFFLARKKTAFREGLDILCTLPMVLPPTVLGYYLLVAFGSQSFFGQWLKEHNIELIFTLKGAIIAAVLVTFPLIFKPARAAFESVDRDYERAGKILGVPPFSLFFRVVMPLAWRGIFSGILLAFVRALGEFGATLMVAGNIPGRTQTLSIAIYDAIQGGEMNTVNYLVFVISLTCIILLILANFLSPNYSKRGEAS